MPLRSPRPCAHVGCGRAVDRGYCATHEPAATARRARSSKQDHRRYNTRRPESDKFYGTTSWKRCRNQHLRLNPLCVVCKGEGRTVMAQVVDHILPYKERPDLGLTHSNLRSLCTLCHARVGARVGGPKKFDK